MICHVLLGLKLAIVRFVVNCCILLSRRYCTHASCKKSKLINLPLLLRLFEYRPRWFAALHHLQLLLLPPMIDNRPDLMMRKWRLPLPCSTWPSIDNLILTNIVLMAVHLLARLQHHQQHHLTVIWTFQAHHEVVETAQPNQHNQFFYIFVTDSDIVYCSCFEILFFFFKTKKSSLHYIVALWLHLFTVIWPTSVCA